MAYCTQHFSKPQKRFKKSEEVEGTTPIGKSPDNYHPSNPLADKKLISRPIRKYIKVVEKQGAREFKALQCSDLVTRG